MKKSVAMKWVAALRSGEYHQGSKRLKKLDSTSPTGVSYCCLGVLCEISGAESELCKISGMEEDYEFSGEVACLNESLRKKVGMVSSLGMLKSANHQPSVSLAALNDSSFDDLGRFTFDEIADIIQICYKEL